MKPAAKEIASIGILLLLLSAVLPPRALGPGNLVATRFSDAITQYLPHQLFARQCVMEDRRPPFWNPYECAGTPAFPNPLYPALSLPSLLLLPLPPPLALNLGFLAHLLMAGAFAFIFARRAGCSRAASIFAGIAYGMGARCLSHMQAGLYSRMVVFAYIPLIFLCAERCLAAPSPASSAIFAASLSLAILSGEAQILSCALSCLAGYAAVRSWLPPPGMPPLASPRRSWACAISGAVLSLPLSAFYLLPSVRLYPLLSRSCALGAARLDFMPPFRAIAAALLSPALIGEFGPSGTLPWECALFMGAAPLALIARAALDGRGRRGLAPWGLLAIAALLLSSRELAPLHAAVARVAPLAGQFRNPGRMLYIASFFLAVIAARAFDASVAGKGRAAGWLAVLAGGVLVYALLLAALRGADYGALAREYIRRFGEFFGASQAAGLDAADIELGAYLFARGAARSLLFSLLLIPPVCLVCALRERRRVGPRVLAAALLSAAFIELLLSSRLFIEVHPLAELYPRSPLAAAVAGERAGGRLLDMTPPPAAAFWTVFPHYRSTRLRIGRVDGYTPVNLTAYARYLDRMSGGRGPLPRWSLGAGAIASPGMLSLLGAGIVLSRSPRDLPGFCLLGEYSDVPVYRQFVGGEIEPTVFLYRNRHRLPRAWLVPRARICRAPDWGGALASLDPFTEAIVAAGGARAFSGGEAFRTARVTREAPGLLEVEVETRGQAYLCTREIWAPGWSARDGRAARAVERLNGIFCGVYLPPGRHSIRLCYTPPGLRAGAGISLLALAALVASICGGKRGGSPRATIGGPSAAPRRE
jgi:hypothetical protein